ncbi:MAG: tetratricopeptide repeat protein, partial [Planctomycetaceae bacterium]
GTEAMAKENWDYAIDMFTKSVVLVPDNLTYRQTLRGCERRKYNDNGRGARMAGIKLVAVRGKLKKAQLKKDWKTADQVSEEGLKVNPWDGSMNADMGQACRELGYDDCAIYGYQLAVVSDSSNRDYNRHLARLLELKGNYNEAIKCWENIRKVDHHDAEARRKIGELSTQSVIEKGGYEDAEGTHDVEKSKSAYDDYRLSDSQRNSGEQGPGMDPEKDLEMAIRKNPSEVASYLKLAELNRTKKYLEKASEIYQKALEVSGGDHNVRQELEDVQLEIIRQNLDRAKSQSRANPDNATARKNSVALASELVQREIEVLASRVERYPNDSRLKFELAKRYMRTKKNNMAIPLLQQATADQRIESSVLISLGECFITEKKLGLAIRQFKKALPKLDVHDQPDQFKKCHYLLARLSQDAGQTDDAEEHYNEILAVDYEYKDVLVRLEKLQGSES